MSTNVAPAAANVTPVATVIVASKALVGGVKSIIELQVKLENKFSTLADMLAKEASEKALDRKGARVLLESAYKGYYTQAGEADGLKDKALTEYVETMLAKKAPDRSKIITLAYPSDERAATELAEAKKAGVGVNLQLEVSRGNITAAEAIAKSQGKGPEGASKGARTPDVTQTSTTTSTTTTPQAEAQAAVAAGMTPADKFGNQIAALMALGKALGMSLEAQMDAITAAYADAGASEAEGAEASK